MKDRGKSVVVSSSSNNCFSESYYSSSSDGPCRKHPSSSGGICAYCLKDRLIKLVCSDCGEQRLSSCSCSDISSSYPNSCVVDIGSVGRISFLLENDKEKEEMIPHSNTKLSYFLKRSSSTSTDVKRGGGLWKLGKLFRKKKGKDFVGRDNEGSIMGSFVSRSRSMCGYRDGCEDGHAQSEKRRGSFIDFDETFGDDDSGFIDIKFGFSSESKPEFFSVSEPSGVKICRVNEPHSLKYLAQEDGLFSNGSSCRISVDDKEIKKCRKSLKVWKWILKHQSSGSGRNSFKKGEEGVS